MRILRVAAAVLLLVAAGFWWINRAPGDDIRYFESNSMVLVDELPDGSTVSLNRNSSIKFEQAIDRKLTLEGDAFFEVKRNERSPFIVQAGEIQVRVLGTAFYVNAKADDPNVEVMVKSGRVAVKHGQDSLILSAGQGAVYDKSSKTLIQQTIEDINYLSWKTMDLRFVDDQLKQVAQKLEDVYATPIELGSTEMENCKITVTFKQQDLEAVLAIIAETLDLSVAKKDSGFVLKGSGCGQ